MVDEPHDDEDIYLWLLSVSWIFSYWPHIDVVGEITRIGSYAISVVSSSNSFDAWDLC